MPTILTQAQRRFFKVLLGLALFMLANSAYLFTSDQTLTVFYQLMLLGHLAGGILLLVLATVFVFWHLRRVRKLMRPPAVSSGVALTLSAYLLFLTGLFIVYEANARDNRWIFVSHQVLALLAPVLYGAHRWVSHFPPQRRTTVRCAVAFAVLFLGFLAAHFASKPGSAPETVAAARPPDPFLPFRPRNYPDPSSPFFPAATTTESGNFLDVIDITRGDSRNTDRIAADLDTYGFAAHTTIGAETCRRCHPDVVAQWESSAHRFSSFNNPFYRAAIERMRETVGKRKSQWCAGCHDPAIMLPGNMEKEIDPLSPESQAGLTCLACHAIDAVHGVEGNGSYNVRDETPSPYLFDAESSGFGRFIADLLTKSKPAAHKAMFKTPVFETAEFCSVCHKVSLDVPVNDYRYLRGQDEYDNWHDSGVSLNAARTFYLPDEAKSCRDCHMPLEDAPLGDVAAKDGKVRSHRFPAVNTALPWLRGDFEQIERIEGFLRDGKMWVDVFAVERADGALVRAVDRTRPVLAAGEEVVFEVVVRNKGVGHTFPGGTNDSNEGWIDFRVTDDAGHEVFRSGAIGADGHVDPRAHFYRVVMVRHDGTEATQRDAHNFHVAAFSRVIGPGTADVARYGFTVPPGAAGARLHVEARLQWRKFNRTYTEFVFTRPGISVPKLPHLEGKKIPDLPVTTIARSAVALDVRDQPGGAAPLDDPDEWVRFNDHGIASLLQGAFDVAEASFAEVARLQPDRPDGYVNQARRWILSATPERARPLLDRAAALPGNNPQLAYFFGRYYERIEEYEEAARAYRATVQPGAFPGDRDTWRRLGGALYKLHRYEESLRAYLKVLAIDPEDVEAHQRRRDIYRQLGREAEAAEAQKAFDKYKKDDHGEETARRFLLDHPEINHEAQPRHVHR